MGREVRRVPKDWQHPRDELGNYIPMCDGDQETACKEYERNVVLWACGAHPSQRDEFGASIRYYWDYAGRPPPEYGERACHMFESPRDDLTHFMLYESTSEGTPHHDCPAFETMDELIDWAAENATTFGYCSATREEWADMLGHGHVYHEVKTPGAVLRFC